MAEEWRSRNPNAGTRRRYNELMRLLAENLCGVDVNFTACIVTCFSLYLAFLDQMEPKEIIELREALERDTRTKLLPRILWEKNEENRPRPPRLSTIREIDFFQFPITPEFDLVIGNPPWVSRKDQDSRSAAEWVFCKELNPAAIGIKKSEASQTLFPAKEVACGFMWKAAMHAKPSGRVCQVLPSRVFLSNNTDRFQAHWLKYHRLESVWLLADYSFILFPGSDCPCFIGRYHPRANGELLGEFEFVTPKVELLDPREALIPVQPEDQKFLSEGEIVTASDQTECAYIWKKQHWGTPRDVQLIHRLMRLPKLNDLCARPPRMKRDTRSSRSAENKKRWWRGVGFQPLTESDMRGPVDESTGAKPWPIWWDKQHLFISAENASSVFFLEGTEPYGERSKQLRRTIPPELTKKPLLLINKACTKFLFSNVNVLFQDDFQAICAPENDEEELLFLTAVFSSSLAQYVLFHTTANIGIERDIARLEELLALPFPMPSNLRNAEQKKVIIHNCAQTLRFLKLDLSNPKNLIHRDSLIAEAQVKINTYVYKYFDVSDWERYLIEDTVDVFRPSSTPGSVFSEKLITATASNHIHRKTYAATLIKTFKGWTHSTSNLWAMTTIASKAKLAILTFGVGGRSREYNEIVSDYRVEELLRRIHESSTRSQTSTFSLLRGFVFYEGSQAHVIKPLARRYWTRTAALNDADEILVHMMKEDGWGA